MRHLNHRGLTLIELMVGLAIGAFLMMTAAPYFTDYITNSRLREAGNLLFAEALAAQSEAVKRNTVVRIETSGNTITLTDRTVPDAPVTLRTRQAVGNTSYTNATLDFGSEGRPVPFGTVGSVNVSMSSVTCSADNRCPGLRVDAGGAVRLCNNQLSGC
ncbi:MAG: GspH/FimT family pseudopilin [Rubrivivax sp.]|jgi:type IV fimbrial biogenesis protein FimT